MDLTGSDLVSIVIGIAGGVVAGLLVRHRIDTGGLGEWRATAKTLTWRDRWTLYRSTSRGRAVPRRELAGLAVLRGELAAAGLESLTRARWRRAALYIGSAFWLAVLAVEVATAQWGWAAVAAALGVVTAFGFRLERIGIARIRRGVELNRDLAAGSAPHA